MKAEINNIMKVIEALPDDHTPLRLAWTQEPTSLDTGDLKALAAELTAYRDFVGAIDNVGLHDPYHGVWAMVDGEEVFAFKDSECDIIATGADPFDAWRKTQEKIIGESENKS